MRRFDGKLPPNSGDSAVGSPSAAAAGVPRGMAAPTAAAVRAGDVAPLGRDALLARRPRAAREREPGGRAKLQTLGSLARWQDWLHWALLRPCEPGPHGGRRASQVRCAPAHTDVRRGPARGSPLRGGGREVGGGGGVSVAGCVQVIALRTRSVAGGGGQAEGGREEGGDYSSVVERVRRGEGRGNGSATGWQSARRTLRARDCSLARLAGRRRAPACSPPTRTHTWARVPARSLTRAVPHAGRSALW